MSLLPLEIPPADGEAGSANPKSAIRNPQSLPGSPTTAPGEARRPTAPASPGRPDRPRRAIAEIPYPPGLAAANKPGVTDAIRRGAAARSETIPPADRRVRLGHSHHCRTCGRWTRSGGGCPGTATADTARPVCHPAEGNSAMLARLARAWMVGAAALLAAAVWWGATTAEGGCATATMAEGATATMAAVPQNTDAGSTLARLDVPRGAEVLHASAPAAIVSCVDSLSALLDAIRQVESGGDCRAVGDGGRSIGPYQISAAYWLDAGGELAHYRRDAHNDAAARAAVLDYWRRWCPKAVHAGDWQTLARVHNGGPTGAGKPATLPYWRRVRAAMQGDRRGAEALNDATEADLGGATTAARP